ncbi:hypothetical protein BDR26DRAFT_918403 [Obelidium mucronatum]|nr:hypothetical protein BDR26DRAFT_918403 [Obelidium mucronatum]
MDVAYFTTNLLDLFTYYTPITNESVWWFEAQNNGTKNHAIQSICQSERTTAETKLSLFQILEFTFTLPNESLTDIEECLRAYGMTFTATNNSWDLFSFDPFTPGAKKWFTNAIDDNSMMLEKSTNRVCQLYDTVNEINTVLRYLSSDRISSTSCGESVAFRTDPSSPTSVKWFRDQLPEDQIHAIVRLCSREFGTEYLDMVFKNLTESTTNQTTQSVMQMCIKMRDRSISSIFVEYQDSELLALPVVLWFTVQPVSVQLTTIEYLYSGVVFYDATVIYTTQRLWTFFSTCIKHMKSMDIQTGMLELEIRFWEQGYASMPQLNDDYLETINLIWFESQNTTVRLSAVDFICNHPNVNSSVAFNVFRSFWSNAEVMDHSVKLAMAQCPKLWDTQGITLRQLYVFYGGLCFDAVLVVAFVIVWFRFESKNKIGKQLNNRFAIVLGINILSLICCNIVCAFLWRELYVNFNDSRSIAYALLFLIAAIWDLSFLLMSWLRSNSIIQQVWPNSYAAIQAAFMASPFILFFPFITSMVELNTGIGPTPTWGAQGFSGTFMFLLDLILLVTFGKFVMILKQDMNRETAASFVQFQIISRFGAVANSVCLLISINAILRPFVTRFWNWSSWNVDALTWSVVGSVLLRNVVSAIMLGMKWRLYVFHEQRRRQSAKDAVI